MAVYDGQWIMVFCLRLKKLISVCRDANIRNFRIRISMFKTRHVATLTVLAPHNCPAVTHDGWQVVNSVKVLAFNAVSVVAVVNNRKVKFRHIQTIERLQSRQKIAYILASNEGEAP